MRPGSRSPVRRPTTAGRSRRAVAAGRRSRRVGRSIARCARSRTTSCAWAAWSRSQIRRPSRRSSARCRGGHWRSSPATGASTRCSDVSDLITTAIATQHPVARDLRFLLALDHVTYELERMGDHAVIGRQAGRKLAPVPPLEGYVDLPELAALVADQVRGILRALVDIDDERARTVAAARRRDRRPVPPDLRRGPRADARRTRTTSTAARASSSRPTTWSASATASRTSPRTSSSSPPARSRTSTPDRHATRSCPLRLHRRTRRAARWPRRSWPPGAAPAFAAASAGA